MHKRAVNWGYMGVTSLNAFGVQDYYRVLTADAVRFVLMQFEVLQIAVRGWLA